MGAINLIVTLFSGLWLHCRGSKDRRRETQRSTDRDNAFISRGSADVDHGSESGT